MDSAKLSKFCGVAFGFETWPEYISASCGTSSTPRPFKSETVRFLAETFERAFNEPPQAGAE
jgi:hypothetical protein